MTAQEALGLKRNEPTRQQGGIRGIYKAGERRNGCHFLQPHVDLAHREGLACGKVFLFFVFVFTEPSAC